ncbi:TPA: hypothetical protein DD449_05410 [Candidatus Berkelbacteria bacterium]|uniref:Uncharacterized protein n=1 Tax=Berkelbacteria bacterium GW2011_GWE1_39_12 TaxID=1618337 RepID=A0A0G4B4N7_9BACT|nr:MAG: hypothetical protein UT28_C0001G0155 [Berkelbacteria bacterium GW2011_GWE1_39_12]HBO61081.1 hypothetical protein [Candidatus Berkelbacteria bacterium]
MSLAEKDLRKIVFAIADQDTSDRLTVVFMICCAKQNSYETLDQKIGRLQLSDRKIANIRDNIHGDLDCLINLSRQSMKSLGIHWLFDEYHVGSCNTDEYREALKKYFEGYLTFKRDSAKS